MADDSVVALWVENVLHASLDRPLEVREIVDACPPGATSRRQVNRVLASRGDVFVRVDGSPPLFTLAPGRAVSRPVLPTLYVPTPARSEHQTSAPHTRPSSTSPPPPPPPVPSPSAHRAGEAAGGGVAPAACVPACSGAMHATDVDEFVSAGSSGSSSRHTLVSCHPGDGHAGVGASGTLLPGGDAPTIATGAAFAVVRDGRPLHPLHPVHMVLSGGKVAIDTRSTDGLPVVRRRRLRGLRPRRWPARRYARKRSTRP